jgi:hypothetical protein
MYFKRRFERHFSSKMKRKSRDWDLTLELSCHAGCPTEIGLFRKVSLHIPVCYRFPVMSSKNMVRDVLENILFFSIFNTKHLSPNASKI